jgi:hypothetical protein
MNFGFLLNLLEFFFHFFGIRFELHNFNLKLYNKQYHKNISFHLIMAPQLSGGWQHNYSTKTRQVGRANEQSIFSLMSMSGSL